MWKTKKGDSKDKGGPGNQDLELKIIEVGQMTDPQVDAIAHILFARWLGNHEKEMGKCL